MEKFISGEKLIKDFGWTIFQYFGYMKEGLLQPHDPVRGYRIIDPDTEHGKGVIASFEQCPPKTLEEYEEILRIHDIRALENFRFHCDLHLSTLRSGNNYRDCSKDKVKYKDKVKKTEQKSKKDARNFYDKYLMELNGCIKRSFTLSRYESEAVKQLIEAEKWLFKTADVLAFEKKHGLERPEEPTSQNLPELTSKFEQIPTAQDKAVGQNNIPTIAFYKSGDVWKIGEKGKEKLFNHLKGFEYIAFLIANQSKEFDPLSLESSFEGLPTSQYEENENYQDLEKEGISMAELPIENLTKEDKEKIENMVYNAWEWSKSGKAKDVEAFEKCKKHVEVEYGIFTITTKSGNIKFYLRKRLKPNAERVRKNITRRIKFAINKIEADNRELATFLSKCIHSGNSFHYTPDRTVNWDIKK